MNFSDLIALLDKASAFDLYRLSHVLNGMIDDPRRLMEVKAKLRLGQCVEFFDARNHRVREVRVEQIKQTRAAVRDLEDGRRWDIPLCAINVRGSEAEFHRVETPGLSRSDIQVGDRVGFIDKSGREQSGRVIRLNQKTATIESTDVSWRVSYSLLHKVIDADGET